MQANSVVALERDSPGVEDAHVVIKLRARGDEKEVCLLLNIFFSLFTILLFSSKMFNLDLAMFVHRAELLLETDESFSSRSLVEILFSLDSFNACGAGCCKSNDACSIVFVPCKGHCGVGARDCSCVVCENDEVLSLSRIFPSLEFDNVDMDDRD